MPAGNYAGSRHRSRRLRHLDCGDHREAAKLASRPSKARKVFMMGAVIVSMPKSIGRYTIVDRLAVGGMAELFKATLTGDHGFEKLVAIKKILPHLATDKSFVEMFIDEARITAQLDHQNIVQVFELGTDADT